MEHQGSTFLSGCPAAPGFFYFAKELDELVAEGTPNTSFFRYRDVDAQAQFRKFDTSVGWPTISMALVNMTQGRIVVGIGAHGDYWELESLSTKQCDGKSLVSKGTCDGSRL
jgi:hypothetical protein